MRRYECVVILTPEMQDDDIVSFTETYSGLIRDSGGEVIKIEDWGQKRLAYLVKKKERGRYLLFDFAGMPALMAEMERRLKITEEVIKYMSVKLDDRIDLEAFRAKQEAAAAPKIEAVPAPEPVTEEALPGAETPPAPAAEVEEQAPESATAAPESETTTPETATAAPETEATAPEIETAAPETANVEAGAETKEGA
jgi:small subunit ribosomal protein S6